AATRGGRVTRGTGTGGARYSVLGRGQPEIRTRGVPGRVSGGRDGGPRRGRATAQYVGRILFLHTPDGFGRSELAALLARPGGPTSVRGAGTARNWATVTRLLAMCEA